MYCPVTKNCLSENLIVILDLITELRQHCCIVVCAACTLLYLHKLMVQWIPTQSCSECYMYFFLHKTCRWAVCSCMQASSKRNAISWTEPFLATVCTVCFFPLLLPLLCLTAFDADMCFCLMNAGLWSSSSHEIMKPGLHGCAFLARFLAMV